jgi:hypothetical protein
MLHLPLAGMKTALCAVESTAYMLVSRAAILVVNLSGAIDTDDMGENATLHTVSRFIAVTRLVCMFSLGMN